MIQSMLTTLCVVQGHAHHDGPAVSGAMSFDPACQLLIVSVLPSAKPESNLKPWLGWLDQILKGLEPLPKGKGRSCQRLTTQLAM